MERIQPLAVKVTDLPADPPKKKPKHPPAAPAKPVIAVDKPLSERTKSMYAAPEAKAAKERPDTQGLKSIAERQAELQQAIKPQAAEAQMAVQVGSVRNRLEEFKAAASQSGAVGNKHAAEVGMSMSERIALFKNSAKASSGPKGGHEAVEEEKTEAVRTGKVAELAAKLGSSDSKAAPKAGPVEVTSGIAERIQMLQQAIKSGNSRPKDMPQEGLPSLQDRKSLLFTKAQPSKSVDGMQMESVKDRISLFSGGLRRNEEEQDSSEEEEEEEVKAEPVLSEKKPSTQQSLMAKYASKSTAKAKSAKPVDEERKETGNEEVGPAQIAPEQEREEVRSEEGVDVPEGMEAVREGLAADFDPVEKADIGVEAELQTPDFPPLPPADPPEAQDKEEQRAEELAIQPAPLEEPLPVLEEHGDLLPFPENARGVEEMGIEAPKPESEVLPLLADNTVPAPDIEIPILAEPDFPILEDNQADLPNAHDNQPVPEPLDQKAALPE